MIAPGQASRGGSFANLAVGMHFAQSQIGGDSDLLEHVRSIEPCKDAELDTIRWSRSKTSPASGADESTMVTRWWHDGQDGWLNTDSTSRDGDAIVEQALATWKIPGASGDVDAARVAWNFASPEWSERIASRLPGTAFEEAAAAFDGTLGIASGDVATQFRIYRGRVLEAGRKTLDGATFTVHADESTWVQLLMADQCDYVRRAGRGEFRASGSSFQYLRMFKPIILLLEEARAEIRESAHA